MKFVILQHHYAAAEFWANKLVSLGNGMSADVYLLAQCFYLTKQFHRAANLIVSKGLLKVRETIQRASNDDLNSLVDYQSRNGLMTK